jgi:hypothetical protein
LPYGEETSPTEILFARCGAKESGEEKSLVMEEVDLKPPSSITKPMDNETGNGRAGIK